MRLLADLDEGQYRHGTGISNSEGDDDEIETSNNTTAHIRSVNSTGQANGQLLVTVPTSCTKELLLTTGKTIRQTQMIQQISTG